MDVRRGYKRTEVGVIPEDWQARALQSICRGIFRGASPRPIADPRWFDDASRIGWVRISDVTQSRRYLHSTTQRLSDDGVKNSRFIPRGSLIMSICATVGRPVETALDTCIHDGFVVFENPLVNQNFLYHVLCELEPRWGRMGQTGSQMNLNTTLIKRTAIPLPPTEQEQRAIATALSDVDALIDKLDQLIAKKRALKQAAMQQLLTGKTRLPGFSGEWEVKRLGEIGEFLKGRGVTRDQSQTGLLPCVRYGELYTTHHNVIRSFASWVCPRVAATALRLCRGDILFAGSGETKEEIGKSAAFVTEGAAYAGGDIVVLRQRGSDPVFLGYALNTSHVNQQKSSYGQGDAVVHISATALAKIRLAIPDLAEQTAIANVLSAMDAEIDALQARRDKTRAIKQGMMQVLLTGQVRLPVISEPMEALA